MGQDFDLLSQRSIGYFIHMKPKQNCDRLLRSSSPYGSFTGTKYRCHEEPQLFYLTFSIWRIFNKMQEKVTCAFAHCVGNVGHICQHCICICNKWTSSFIKVKGEVVRVLFLTEHHAMKVYWGVEYSSTHSLTSALDGGEWSASLPGRFTPKEIAPNTHWIGGWVGPRAVLDAMVKRKIPSPRQESNPWTPIVQPVAQRHTDWAITALASSFIKKDSYKKLV
jgi:hypothetical protein